MQGVECRVQGFAGDLELARRRAEELDAVVRDVV